MTFKIIVCVKQVPDTADIKWTEHNTINREGLDSIINPYDLGAIKLAQNFKLMLSRRLSNIEIIAVTMGPPQAQDVLKKAISLGCDGAYMLSDKKFACADTLATAYTLSQFVHIKVPDYKLIICGQQAIDGDTAQTPSSMAEKLGIRQITNVIGIKEVNEAYSIWSTDTTDSYQEIKSGYPLLVATKLKDLDLLPNINGYIKAHNTKIEILSAEDLALDSNKIGLKGSPTKVKTAFRPNYQKNTLVIDNQSNADCADFILGEIEKCRINNEQ